MKTLEHSLPEPAHNLACDEILLDEVNGERSGPVLRFWESTRHCVVVGYGNSIERECDTEVCKRLGIPILRRISGGRRRPAGARLPELLAGDAHQPRRCHAIHRRHELPHHDYAP